MKYFRALLIALIPTLCLAAGTNGTQTANLAWTPPTSYSDGTTLPSGDIAFYTVVWNGPAGTAQQKTVTAPATGTTVPNLCGTVTLSVSVTTSATAAYPNSVSPASNTATFTSSVACAPKAPTNFTVS